jgi:hypothetical protein
MMNKTILKEIVLTLKKERPSTHPGRGSLLLRRKTFAQQGESLNQRNNLIHSV